MKQSSYNSDEIKEKMTYYVLNSIKNEVSPNDDNLKEIFSNVISDEVPSLNLFLQYKRS